MRRKAEVHGMTRKEITDFLGNLLIKEKFSGLGKYWASEVSIDYGTTDVKRVDFMQFQPAGVVGVSGIEKGIFTCYEVKSCNDDFYSGFGRNFIAEKNYFVMPMATYKEVIRDIPSGIGVLVPIPENTGNTNDERYKEFENPTELSEEIQWKFWSIRHPREQIRKKSMAELLFCMLRSGR